MFPPFPRFQVSTPGAPGVTRPGPGQTPTTLTPLLAPGGQAAAIPPVTKADLMAALAGIIERKPLAGGGLVRGFTVPIEGEAPAVALEELEERPAAATLPAAGAAGAAATGIASPRTNREVILEQLSQLAERLRPEPVVTLPVEPSPTAPVQLPLEPGTSTLRQVPTEEDPRLLRGLLRLLGGQ